MDDEPRAERRLWIPLAFVLLGPPAGAMAALSVVLAGSASGGELPGAAWHHMGELVAVALVGSWPLGGVPALLVGLAARRSARRTGRVRAGPVLLAALALVPPSAMALDVLAPLGGLPASGVAVITLVAHAVGAAAGLGAVRVLEHRARRAEREGDR